MKDFTKITLLFLFTLILSFLGKDIFVTNNTNVVLIQTSILVSFLGGLLAFLSPCAGFIIPSSSYFMTIENKLKPLIYFYLGFILLFIPLTIAGSIVAKTLIPYTKYFYYFSALILFIAAFRELFIMNCEIKKINKESHLTPLLMGFSYSFTSIGCTGPILGAIITLSYAKGLFLLYPFILAISFAFGMILPVILLSNFPGLKKFFAKEPKLIHIKILHFNKIITLNQLIRFTILILSGVLIIIFSGFENNIYEKIAVKLMNGNY